MADVKLLGFLPSPFSQRVIWALKLKGVSYEYIEEDIFNKSDLLLQYNPVHKKIPVLVHGEKVIVESMVILEYIDETWPETYPLLPQDPYERSQVRFWANFIADKTVPMMYFFRCAGEEQEKAIDESLQIMEVIEKHGLGRTKFFGGDKIGLADIALGWTIHTLEIIEEIVGVKCVEADRFPRLYAWKQHFKEIPVIKDNLPDIHEQGMLDFFKRRREFFIKSPQIPQESHHL